MKEIIDATKNFRHDMYIGEGILCQVFKAWIDEHTLTASNPESGMAVAVKICHERNRNWLVGLFPKINVGKLHFDTSHLEILTILCPDF